MVDHVRDLNAAYKPLLVATGVRFQEEELGPEMELISPEGLVMGRLPDFSKENDEDKFPELEKQLPTLRETLKQIKDVPGSFFALAVRLVFLERDLILELGHGLRHHLV